MDSHLPVQSLEPQHRPNGGMGQINRQHVMAASAEAEATKALREQLFWIRNVERLRAMVWRIGVEASVSRPSCTRKVRAAAEASEEKL